MRPLDYLDLVALVGRSLRVDAGEPQTLRGARQGDASTLSWERTTQFEPLRAASPCGVNALAVLVCWSSAIIRGRATHTLTNDTTYYIVSSPHTILNNEVRVAVRIVTWLHLIKRPQARHKLTRFVAQILNAHVEQYSCNHRRKREAVPTQHQSES